MKCDHTLHLSDICDYVKDKIAITALNRNNYVSTENMLANKAGIVRASSLPAVAQTQAFLSGDVLVSNIRPYFKKIWFAKFDGGCSNDVLVFRAKEGVSSRFLYYVLANDSFFAYSTATSKGTKMPRGDKTAIMGYEVPKITPEEQEKITAILSALDDKIELNNKINANLEQQAQALFKAWFVDNPDISSWQEATFADLVERAVGGDWGKDLPSGNNKEMVYCIRGADIPEVRVGNKGKMPTRYILPKNYAAKKLMDGDIVVEISGGSPTQSTGRAAVVSAALLSRYDKGMVCSNFCKALKPIAGFSMYVYYYWQHLYDTGVFFSYENGTTGIKNLDIKGFLETEPISIAPAELVRRFDRFVRPLFSEVYANGLENERLALTRDTLLPYLMSESDMSELLGE